MESSRLSKLFDLLAASSGILREQAAVQIAEVAVANGDEIGPLLLKIRTFLRHSSWDARYAAAKAVYETATACFRVENESKNYFTSKNDEKTSWEFDLAATLRSGFVLASSEGKEFEKLDSQGDLDASTQKRRLKEQLGVFPALENQLDVDFVSEDDFRQEKGANGGSNYENGGPPLKIAKLEVENEETDTAAYLECQLSNSKAASADQKLWWFYQLLCTDIYNALWTVRHGAALGLKELTKHLTRCPVYLSRLYGCTQHLFVVGAIDRFNDFVGSHAVAPVRECCAQVLGTLFPNLPSDNAETLMKILLQFISTLESKPWQCVHSGLLMLKYTLPFILPLRPKCQSTVDDLLRALCECVKFQNEEIIISASQALSPNLSIISSFVDCDIIEHLLNIVWTLLLTSKYDVLDDWVRGLLHIAAELGTAYREPYWTEHVSVLSVFLGHPSVEVILPAVRCLTVAARRSQLDWPEQGILHILRMSFLKSLTTTDETLFTEMETLWLELIRCKPSNSHVIQPICPFFGQWLASLMVVENYPFIDPTLLGFEDRQIYIGGEDVMALNESERFAVVTRVKMKCIKLLAYLAIELYEMVPKEIAGNRENPISSLENCFLFHLNSTSLVRKTVVCQLLIEWAKIKKKQGTSPVAFPFTFENVVLTNLTQNALIYEELMPKLTELNALCQDFSQTLRNTYKINMEFQTVVNAKDIAEISHQFIDQITEIATKKLQQAVDFIDKFSSFKNEVNSRSCDILQSTNRLLAWFSCVAVHFSILPEKLNPIIIPIMEIIKTESNPSIVEQTSESLAQLILQTVSRNPSPSWKILKNLIVLHCVDESRTPQLLPDSRNIQLFNSEKRLTFDLELPSSRKNTTATDISSKTIAQLNKSLASVNAGSVLCKVCSMCSDGLDEIIPNFWAILYEFSENESQDLIYSLQVLETVLSSLTAAQRNKISHSSKDKLLKFISSKEYSIRNMAARLIANLASMDVLFVVNELVPTMLKCLNDSQTESSRIGAMEAIFVMVEEAKVNLVGISSILALPVLARMSDPVNCMRQMSSRCFGSLVKLLPLEAKTEMVGLSAEIKTMLNEQRQFLNLLACPDQLSKLDLQISDVTKAELRSYQKDGVTWLLFLNKYNLHGILSDDMGLGKTLQTLCCLALTSESNEDNLPSLIVCPKTLVQHWVNETSKFFNSDMLQAANRDAPGFAGHVNSLEKCNVLVTSYDFLRRETKVFESQKFHYCILDEGHVIKNPKTLTTKAVMQLKSNYRLVLSGTPVQNNVLELWSLFEFLIPGYLGDRRQFQQRFGKPILSARDAKASSNEMHAGQSALESLHKMVLPFILRRRKADVLDELPPKIVQDYYCVLSQLQKKLYQDFSQTALSNLVNQFAGSSRNAFQILTYLRKLCDHPCLVLTKGHCAYEEVTDSLKPVYGCDSVNDISLSGKIVALRQLLLECGIGRVADDDDDEQGIPAVSAHRALIFCQFKSVVDLIANYFQQNVFGSISYLRLDGTVPPSERQAIAERFNQDLSIDALLLTTHIGGLGLNLTGADVVIFVDHDWNPARDLQAMDRAHRIGQKRTVNVYRLITQGTLEEKIMRFQLFKSQNADAIIGEQNRSLASMATDQLLDLLSMDGSQKIDSSTGNSGKRKSKKLQATPDQQQVAGTTDLTALWDESQYEEAFDLNKFLQTMRPDNQ